MRFICLLLASMAYSAVAIAGPFGTEIGMLKGDLGITSTTKRIGGESDYKWELKSLPKSSSLFDSYIVKVTPQNGLCFIKAFGKDVSTSRYGEGLRGNFERVNSALEKKYQRGDTQDFVRYGSIWDDPEDFMMGLIKKERVLAAYYDEEENSVMVEGVAKAYLRASAFSQDEGFVYIDYFFDNYEACKAEADAEMDDVF